MAYTFLQLVNKTLREAREISGDQSELTSFEDSARSARIDIARQAWLEVVQEVFDLVPVPMPQATKTATVTLVEGTSSNDWGREYQLPGDLVTIRWPLINEDKGYTIEEYPGGFEGMRKDQLQPRQFTGRPLFGCIEPVRGYLRVETDPTSDDAGIAYQLYYNRYIKPYHSFDTMPFADNVADALVPCSAQLYNRRMKQTFDAGIFNVNLGRAARQLTKTPIRDSW